MNRWETQQWGMTRRRELRSACHKYGVACAIESFKSEESLCKLWANQLWLRSWDSQTIPSRNDPPRRAACELSAEEVETCPECLNRIALKRFFKISPVKHHIAGKEVVDFKAELVEKYEKEIKKCHRVESTPRYAID
jgi:hypothetical protein